MLWLRKINFTKAEIKEITKALDGYAWIVMDIKKGIVVVGDEYVMNMKNILLKDRCSLEDIFGVGLDLATGEIDYYSQVNIKWTDKDSTREVPLGQRVRVTTLIEYFFMELPAFRKETSKKYPTNRSLFRMRRVER